MQYGVKDMLKDLGNILTYVFLVAVGFLSYVAFFYVFIVFIFAPIYRLFVG